MNEITDFIAARLAEDEWWAREASRKDDHPVPESGHHWQWETNEGDEVVTPDPMISEYLTEDGAVSLRSVEEYPSNLRIPLPHFAIHAVDEIPTAVGGHIVRHDPARVLREVEFKRKLLALYTPQPREPEADAELHARCAHPEWEYETTTGQRKAFDDYDVPPYDPATHEPDHTWERNTDAGRDGWERFDYTEESYWRRRLPAAKVRQPYVPEELKLLAALYDWHPDYNPAWRPDAEG